MLLRDKFFLFAMLRGAPGSLLPALILVFLFGSAVVNPPAVASAMRTALPGLNEQAAVGEARMPGAAAPLPDKPAPCFDRQYPCGPGASAMAPAAALALGLTEQVRFATPRAPEQISVPDVAPRLAACLSILFRNFRE